MVLDSARAVNVLTRRQDQRIARALRPEAGGAPPDDAQSAYVIGVERQLKYVSVTAALGSELSIKDSTRNRSPSKDASAKNILLMLSVRNLTELACLSLSNDKTISICIVVACLGLVGAFSKS